MLTLLTASTGDGPEAALWRVTPSALHFFVATLLHVQPTQPLGPSLAETLSICIQLKTRDATMTAETPPLHEIVVEIINAACAGEPLRVLRAALMPALQGSWVAAHAAALMAQDGRYADLLGPQLPSVRSLSLSLSLSPWHSHSHHSQIKHWTHESSCRTPTSTAPMHVYPMHLARTTQTQPGHLQRGRAALLHRHQLQQLRHAAPPSRGARHHEQLPVAANHGHTTSLRGPTGGVGSGGRKEGRMNEWGAE